MDFVSGLCFPLSLIHVWVSDKLYHQECNKTTPASDYLECISWLTFITLFSSTIVFVRLSWWYWIIIIIISITFICEGIIIVIDIIFTGRTSKWFVCFIIITITFIRIITITIFFYSIIIIIIIPFIRYCFSFCLLKTFLTTASFDIVFIFDIDLDLELFECK